MRRELLQRETDRSFDGQILYADVYIAMTDGGDEPVTHCSNCEAETHILAEEICASCGDSLAVYRCGDCAIEVDGDDFTRHDGRCVPCYLANEAMADESI